MPGEDIFEARLEGLLRRAGNTVPLVGATLEVVALDEAALATSWELIKLRVRQVAEPELQRLLEPNAFYCVHGDLFLVCFAEANTASAGEKLQLVSQRIADLLLAECADVQAFAKPEHFVATVEPSLLKQHGGGLTERFHDALLALKKQAGSAAPPADLSQLVDSTRLLFAPAWNASRNVLALNRCILDGAGQNLGSAPMYFDLAEDEPRRPAVQLDHLVLAKAGRVQAMLLREGRIAPLLVTVRYSTLSEAAGHRDYLNVVQSIPASQRHFLALEIVEIPSAEPAATVVEVANTLARFTKWLSLNLALADPRIPECAARPVWALATDVSSARSTDGQLHAGLRRLRDIAAAARINTLAHGVNSIGLAMAGLEAGITYMDGPAIHPLASDPRGMGPLKPLSYDSWSRSAAVGRKRMVERMSTNAGK
jgi:hypothetical protein